MTQASVCWDGTIVEARECNCLSPPPIYDVRLPFIGDRPTDSLPWWVWLVVLGILCTGVTVACAYKRNKVRQWFRYQRAPTETSCTYCFDLHWVNKRNTIGIWKIKDDRKLSECSSC